MSWRRAFLVGSITSILSLGSSSCLPRRPVEVRMGELSSAVTKLTADVESAVRYGQISGNLSQPELLTKATEKDPEILKFLSRYSVLIAHNDRDAMILVCTKDRKEALFEDAGCTAALDWILWKDKPPRSCAFTTTVEAACPRK